MWGISPEDGGSIASHLGVLHGTGRSGGIKDLLPIGTGIKTGLLVAFPFSAKPEPVSGEREGGSHRGGPSAESFSPTHETETWARVGVPLPGNMVSVLRGQPGMTEGSQGWWLSMGDPTSMGDPMSIPLMGC